MRRMIMAGMAGAMCMGGGFSGRAAEDLDGAAGKVFDVDLGARSFRFLKQDVTYDAETGKGIAWHTVHWTDATTFQQYEERPNLSGIEGPVIAQFTGLDDENAKALAEGRSFRADRVALRPDLKDAAGLAADGRSVAGWFTPRQARFSRDGTLKLGDREIDAGVKRGGVRIAIEQRRTAADLAEGCWKAMLEGSVKDGRFVAEHLRLEPLVNPFEVDDPKLPRVLSVGDSISMNYEQAAREALKGVANYHRIEDNCWSTHRGVAFMAYWLGDYTRKGLQWDVILFNSGLHDMKQKTLGGPFAVPVEVYKTNLKKEIELMKPTGATLVWVATTPVPNDSGSAQYAFRTKGAEKVFNEAALEVLRDYPEIRILDLSRVVSESGVMDAWRKGRDVHFWKAEEQAVVGKAVAEAVVEALGARAGAPAPAR